MNRTEAAVTVNGTSTTVATLELPAGSYLIYAKANVVRNGGNGSSECIVFNGSEAVDTVVNQGTPTGEVNFAHGAVTLTDTTTLTYGCRITANTATVSNRTFSAIRITSLTVQ